MVEWSKRLGYGAESRRKVIGSRLGFAMRRLGDSVNPAANGYLFQTREANGSERRGMGFAFHFLCPRYIGTLSFTASKAIRLWETFTFTLFVFLLYLR